MVTSILIEYTEVCLKSRFLMFVNSIYILSVLVLCTGLYIMIADNNYMRKIMGLGIFQTACLIFFLAMGKVGSGIIPFDKCLGAEKCAYTYSASLPHVLMLTAIVVGFATLSVGLAFIYRIKQNFGTIVETTITENV